MTNPSPATTPSKPVRSAALRQIAEDAPAYPDYKPLDSSRREIRLLDLGPAFQYTLRHVSLDDNPTYSTLSYYWGAPGITKSIWLNNHEIQLRKTVYQFLKSLYRQFGPITVWLDIVSINQRDFREQSSQVQMMGDIYRSAARVYAWLGKGNADTDHAMKSLLSDSHDTQATTRKTLSCSYGARYVTSGLRQLFSHPYWTRLWIIQECILIPNLLLVCGSHSVPWSAIRSSGYIENEAPPIPSALGMTTEEFPDLTELRRIIEKFEQERCVFHCPSRAKIRNDSDTDKGTLLGLLGRWGKAQCGEPIDKLYGLLALATDRKFFAVDYDLNRFDAVVRLVSAHEQPEYHRWHEQHLGELSDQAPGDRNIILTRKMICHYVDMSADQILAGCQNRLTDNLTLECSAPAAVCSDSPYLALVETPLQWGEWMLRNVAAFKNEFHASLAWESLDDPYFEASASAGAPFERTLRSVHLSNINICVEILPDGHLGTVGTTVDSLVNSFQIYGSRAEDFDMRNVAETHADFQRLSQKHTWPCRARQAVHISRLLYAVLIHLDTARYGVVTDLDKVGSVRFDEKEQNRYPPASIHIPKWLLDYGLSNTPSRGIMVCRCPGLEESGIPDEPLLGFKPVRRSPERAAVRMHSQWLESKAVAKLFEHHRETSPRPMRRRGGRWKFKQTLSGSLIPLARDGREAAGQA